MIANYSFGKMRIGDKKFNKDLKIIRGEIKENWWRKEGHRLDVDDLADIFQANPAVLVIGTGHDGNLHVPDAVLSACEERNMRVIAEPTAEAAKTFNTLVAENEHVAAAFHLTC